MALITTVKLLLQHKQIGSFIRFCTVGVIATLINYVSFYVLYEKFNLQYLLASMIGYITGLGIGYYLNKSWTFNIAEKSIHFIVKYCIVYLISLIINLIVLAILVEWGKLNPLLGNVFSIIITTFTNFFGVKYFAFKK